MISISQIESLSHGLDYYTKDNYYSKDDQKEFTQWYGKAAKNLGLKGEVSFSAFQKALIGVSISGKIGIQTAKKETSDAISVDKIAEFKSDTSTYIQSLNIDNESKIKIHEILDQISNSNTKIQKTRLEKHQNKIFSVINKQTELSIEEKISIKNNIKSKTEVFKKTASRRSGYDLTFSAPKSVSLQALVHGDKAILEAHRESVKCALAIVEKEYSQIRIREKGKSDRKIEVTGNIAAAMFEHDVSRKTDPQLHTHCVLMNFTKKSDGSWRSINQDGFYYNSKQIGSIYQNELAKRVQALGYDIKLNGNGTFDIKGYSDVQLLQFSKRTEQLRALGAQTQKQATKLIKKNRDKKDESISRESLLEKWKEEAIAVGINQPLPQIFSNSKAYVNTKNQDDLSLTKIIETSVKELTDRDVSFKKAALISSILGKSLGNYEYHEVLKEIETYLNQNTHEIGSKNVKEYIPLHILKLEMDSVSMMQNGKNTFDVILNRDRTAILINEIHNKSIADGFDGLTDGQREAIDLMLTSKDRIFAWQGVAGAGKSFSLGSASKIAMDNNIIVKGFAPSAEAAKNLAAEAKLKEAHTVASLLVKETEIGRAKGKELWIVDEAGLLSARDAHDLLKKAEMENARVLLVGDTRQLSAVGAGNPFKQLQTNGIQTAQLSQGIRQKDETMKKSVDLIANGKHKEGLAILDNSGKIFEVKNTEDIIAKMAKDYLDLNKEEVKKSLFISSTNYEKEEITNLVRSGLKSRGDLKKEAMTNAYVSLDYNEHALKHANVYSVDDVIILNKSSQGLNANHPYKILEIDHPKNTVSVQIDSKIKEISVSKIKCNLFREEKIELCVGDKLKWTKNHSTKSVNNEQKNSNSDRRVNGQNFIVKDINLESNTVILEYENGKQEEINLSKKHFIDYSYVTTVYSSQGKTCDKVYASLTNIDRENFYVAVSRSKYDCKLYTKNKEILYRNVDKSGANTTAFEKISEKVEQNFNFSKSFRDAKPMYLERSQTQSVGVPISSQSQSKKEKQISLSRY
jgi:conjugative relaxase-like TrwC/TraI family protein